MGYLANKLLDVNDLGYFATPTALATAYPVGAPGYFAVVGSTDTIWVWDTGTSTWVNSGADAPRGPTGPTGPTGPRGHTGSASTIPGPTGAKGHTGKTGTTGSRGPTGHTGSGDVVGPSSSADEAVVRFDTTTGKLVQDSLLNISDELSTPNRIHITTPQTSGVGRSINIFGGFSTGASAGACYIAGGNSSGGNGDGGIASAYAGAGNGSGAGGVALVQGGQAGATGIGGQARVIGGPGGATSGAGGNAIIKGGDATNGNSNGGDVIIEPGKKSGSGVDGMIILGVHSGASVGANLDVSQIASSSKTFTFPNTTGTLALTNDTRFNGAEGVATNYKITTVVAFGYLTVALKGLDGNDPSPTNPVTITLAGAVRTITSALYTSITSGASINWFNAGSSELATQEVDYFTYLQWDTIASAVSLDISRLPGARVMGDFDSNAAHEKGVYAGLGNLTATDYVECIGRFNAKLSATPFNWSIPATSIIINRPIYDTRELICISTLGGVSSTVASQINYHLSYDRLTVSPGVRMAGVSNATTFTMTLPFANKNYCYGIPTFGADNSVLLTTPCSIELQAGSGVANLWKTFYQGVWTNTGDKVAYLTGFTYVI